MARLNTQSSVQNVEGADTPSTENKTENKNANQGSNSKKTAYRFKGAYTFHYLGKQYRAGDVLEIDSAVFEKSFKPVAGDWTKV